MCDQCDAIDLQIQRYRWLETQLSDPRTLGGLDVQIKILKERRALLHPSEASRDTD